MSDDLDTCQACGQPLPKPNVVWLTTNDVIVRFGFDPSPHILRLKSKLAALGDGTFTRVWEQDGIAAFPARKE